MAKKGKSAEAIFLYIAAGLSVLISILDIFGFLDIIPWVGERAHVVPLVLLGLILGLTARIVKKLDDVVSILLDTQKSMQEDVLVKMSNLRKQMDPNLEAIFGEHISSLCASLQKAIKERKIQINDVNIFRYFFTRTLNAFPRTTFLATSLPYQKFFWKNPPLEQAMDQFIRNGGRMKRIFFIYDTEELNNEEVKQILQAQCDMGVEVYITNIMAVPSHLRRYLLIEEEERIAWEAHIGPDRQIVYVVATADKETISDYKQIAHELFGLSETQPYEKYLPPCTKPDISYKPPQGGIK